MRINQDFFRAKRVGEAMSLPLDAPEYRVLDAVDTLTGGQARVLIGKGRAPADILAGLQDAIRENDPTRAFTERYRNILQMEAAGDFDGLLKAAKEWDSQGVGALGWGVKKTAEAFMRANFIRDESLYEGESAENIERYRRVLNRDGFQSPEAAAYQPITDPHQEVANAISAANSRPDYDPTGGRKPQKDRILITEEDYKWAKDFDAHLRDKDLVRRYKNAAYAENIPLFLPQIKAELSNTAGSIIDSAVANGMKWDDSRWSDFKRLSQQEREAVATTILMLQNPEEVGAIRAAWRNMAHMLKAVTWDWLADTGGEIVGAINGNYQNEVDARGWRRQMLQEKFADMGVFGNTFAEFGSMIGYMGPTIIGGVLKGAAKAGAQGISHFAINGPRYVAGAEAAMSHADRYRRAARAIRIVKGLDKAGSVVDAASTWMMAGQMREDYLQRIANEGGDVANPLTQLAAATAAYASACVEHIQWEQGFSARAMNKAQIDAYSKIVHSLFGKTAAKYGIRDVAALSLGKAAGIALAERGMAVFYESLEEAIQQTLEEVVVQVGKDQNILLGEALGASVEAFGQSIGPMLWMVAMGAPFKAAGTSLHPVLHAQDRIQVHGESQKVLNWFKNGTWDPGWTRDKAKRKAVRTMGVVMAKWGAAENDRDALDILTGMGFSVKEAVRLDGVFRAIRQEAAVAAADEADLLPDALRAENPVDIMVEAAGGMRGQNKAVSEDGTTVSRDITIGGRTIRLKTQIDRNVSNMADADLTQVSRARARSFVQSMLSTSDATIRAAMQIEGLEVETADTIVNTPELLAKAQRIKQTLHLRDIGGTQTTSVERDESGQVRAVNVAITLDPSAMRGTVRHEAVHAIEEVLKAVGISDENARKLSMSAVRSASLTERQNRMLQGATMLPQGANERWNEEMAPVIAEMMRTESDGPVMDAAKWAWNAARGLLGLQKRQQASRSAVDFLIAAMRTGHFENLDALTFESSAVDEVLHDIINGQPAAGAEDAQAAQEAAGAAEGTEAGEAPSPVPEAAPEAAQTGESATEAPAAEAEAPDPQLAACKLKTRQPVTKAEMAALGQAARDINEDFVWKLGYRWDETDQMWKHDPSMEKPIAAADRPQVPYMGVDGEMHEPEPATDLSGDEELQARQDAEDFFEEDMDSAGEAIMQLREQGMDEADAIRRYIESSGDKLNPLVAEELRKRLPNAMLQDEARAAVEGAGDKHFQIASRLPSPEFAMDGTVVDALPAHLRQDAREIVAERGGTPRWMTDADGTPTELNERDWLRREAEQRHSEPRFSIHSTLATGRNSTVSYVDSQGVKRTLFVERGTRKHGMLKVAYKHCVDYGSAWTGGFTLEELERYEEKILKEGERKYNKVTGNLTFKWKSPEGVTFTIGAYTKGKGKNAREIVNTVYTDRRGLQTKMLGTNARGKTRSSQPSAGKMPRGDREGKREKRFAIAGRIAAERLGIRGLGDAEAMERSGATREDIWRETGWWRGKDGMWRVEIPDITLSMETIDRDAYQNDPEFFVRKRKLADLIGDTALFDAYPYLRRILVQTPHSDSFGGMGTLGDYNGRALIRLNMSAMKFDPEEARATLAHEIQHAIQHQEQFAEGASVGYWQRQIDRGYDARTEGVKEEETRLQAQYERQKAKNPELFADMEALWAIKPNVPRGKFDPDTLEPLEEEPPEWQRYDERRDALQEKYGGAIWDWMDLRSVLDSISNAHRQDAYELYHTTAGEVEARNVEKRLKMTPEERAETPPWKTADVDEGSQIVRFSVAPAGRQKQAGTAYPDAGAEIGDRRFAVGAKRRADYKALLEKKRPDLDAEKVLAELDKFNSPKKEKAALHWTILGTIQLPQDGYKVEDALSVAAKAKVDPLKYRSPLELIEAHREFKPTARPIDPDTVPELDGKMDDGDGITIYVVEDSKAGQLAMRRIIDTHWGEEANPWCLLARTGAKETPTEAFHEWLDRKFPGRPMTSEEVRRHAEEFEASGGVAYNKQPATLGDEAWEWWQKYSALPKLVAFKNGKLLAFMATEGLNEENDPFGDDIGERLPDLQEEYEAWLESEEGREESAGFYDWLRVNYPAELEEASTWEEWWDRQDESHPGLEWAREGGERYSVKAFTDGTRFVHVDVDQEEFEKAKEKDYPKVARRIILKRFRGKVIGGEAPKNAYVKTATAGEFAYPSKPLPREENAAKMRSAGELDNLLAVGEFAGHEPDNGHHPEATGGWDYYNTVFEVGGRFFTGKVNLLINNRGRVFHDVTGIKENTQGLMDQHGEPRAQFPAHFDANQALPDAEVKSENGGEVRHALRAGLGLWDEEAPRTTGNSRMVGLAATMLLAGREEGLAAKLAPVAKELECDITAEEAIARARSMLEGEAAERARKLLRGGKAHQAAAELANAAQGAAIEETLMAAMESGALTALKGQRIQQEALRAVLRNERGMNMDEIYEASGANWIAVFHQRLVELALRKGKDPTAEAQAALDALAAGAQEGAAGEEDEAIELDKLPEDHPRRVAAEAKLADRREKLRRVLGKAKQERAARKAKEEAEAARRAKAAEEAARKAAEAADAETNGKAGAGDVAADNAETPPGIGKEEEGPAMEEVVLSLLKEEDLDFGDPETVAGVLRILVRNEIRRQNGEADPEADMDAKAERAFWRNPTVVHQYALTMKNFIQGMARKLLEHGSWTYNNALRLGQEMGHWESATAIEQTTAALVGRISQASIRQTAWHFCAATRKELKKALSKTRFNELDPDFTRKVKGQLDHEVRWIRAALLLGTAAKEKALEELDKKIAERQDAYAQAGADPEAYKGDNQVLRLARRRAIVEEYGGTYDLLPGEAKAKCDEILAWLAKGMGEFAERMAAREAQTEADKAIVLKAVRHTRKDGTDAVDEGPKNRIEQAERDLYLAGIATIEQRLRDFFRYATGEDDRAARALTLRVCHRLAEATQNYTVLLQEGFQALEAAGIKALGSQRAFYAWLRHIETPMPEAHAVALSKTGIRRMTYGQALNLYGYLCQTDSYAENIAEHGREGQRELLEKNILTPEDLKMVQALRAIYAERREELATVKERITGVGFGTPSPLYLPVKMLMGERSGLAGFASGYQIIPDVFSERRANKRDVDETADIMAVYMGRLDASARAIAYGEVGVDLLNLFGNAEVKDALVRFHGKDFCDDFIEHLTDVLAGVPAKLREANNAISQLLNGTMGLGTYVALWGNLNTALKQSVSQSAHALRRRPGDPSVTSDFFAILRPGGVEALKELMQSRGWKARYGDGGIMDEVRAVMRSRKGGPVWERIKRWGMTPIQIGDALGGIPVALGVYMREKAAYLAAHPGCDVREAMQWASVEAMRQNESTQQSSQAENKPKYARRGGSGARLMMMFASAPMLQASWENLAFREWKAKADPNGDLGLFKAWAKGLLTDTLGGGETGRLWRNYLQAVAINHLLIPTLMEFVSVVFKAMLGEPPPEDELKNWAFLVLLGQYGRYAWMGNLLDFSIRKAFGVDPHGIAPSPFTTLERLIGKGVVTAWDLLTLDFDGALENFDSFLQSLATPYRHVRKAVENYAEAE